MKADPSNYLTAMHKRQCQQLGLTPEHLAITRKASKELEQAMEAWLRRNHLRISPATHRQWRASPEGIAASCVFRIHMQPVWDRDLQS